MAKAKKNGIVTIVKYSQSSAAKCVCHCLWLLDPKKGDRLMGAFPSFEEAEEHQREMYGHWKKSFSIVGIDSALLPVVLKPRY